MNTLLQSVSVLKLSHLTWIVCASILHHLLSLPLPLFTTLIYSHLNIQMTMKLVQYMDSIAINKPKKRVCECVGVYVYIVSSMTQ